MSLLSGNLLVTEQTNDAHAAATTEVGVVYTHCRRGPHCTLSRSCTWASAAPHTSPQRPNLSTTNTDSQTMNSHSTHTQRVKMLIFGFDFRISRDLYNERKSVQAHTRKLLRDRTERIWVFSKRIATFLNRTELKYSNKDLSRLACL